MEFAKLIALTRDLVHQELDRELPDSEVAAIQCMWEGIDYSEFSDKHVQFMSQYKDCYKSVTKSKATPTLASGASRMLKLFSSYYKIESLSRTSFRRKIEAAYENGIIDLQGEGEAEGVSSDSSNFVGRNYEIELLQESIKSKNIIFIWGNPGIGKSALLRYFSQNYLSIDSYFYAKYSDFNSLDSLLQFVYENYFEKPNKVDSIVPYFIEVLTEREFQLIIDFEYDIFPSVGQFLESISNHKLSEDSCIICLLRKNCVSNFDFNQETTLSYRLGPLEDISDYFTYLESLQLKDRTLWKKIIESYEGNFRELNYVSKFIREIFGGSISTYFSLGSLVLSPMAKDYFESIQFSEVDYEIFDIFREKNACISINFFKFLKGNISTSEIFNRIMFLESHGFLSSRNEDGQVNFSLAPLLRAHLKEEGRFAA